MKLLLIALWRREVHEKMKTYSAASICICKQLTLLKKLLNLFRLYARKIARSKLAFRFQVRKAITRTAMATFVLTLHKCFKYYRIKRINNWIHFQIRVFNFSASKNLIFFVFVFFCICSFLSSIHEKANCIAIFWTGRPHSLGSCHF